MVGTSAADIFSTEIGLGTISFSEEYEGPLIVFDFLQSFVFLQ